MTRHYDIRTVLHAARGQWPRIVCALTGISSEFLVDRERSCPCCTDGGGKTRWRVYPDFDQTGGCRCNRCGNWGDGFQFLKFRLNKSLKQVVNLVGEFLQCSPSNQQGASSMISTHSVNESAENPEQRAIACPNEARMPKEDRQSLKKEILRMKARGSAARNSGQDDSEFAAEVKRLEAEYASLHWLADELGVSVESLNSLDVAFDSVEDCWEIPEHNAQRQVIGIQRRLHGGTKKQKAGGKRGLCFATNWSEHKGPVLIVEGASDTAVGITLGLPIIGRPANIVPKDLLPELSMLLSSLPSDRQIIVIGENDEKPDHNWPGRDGAIDTAEKLAGELGRQLYWALPPGEAKDLRKWLLKHPGKSGLHFVESLKLNETKADGRLEPSKSNGVKDASIFLSLKYRCDQGATLKYFRGEFLAWRDFHWIMVSDDEVRAQVALNLADRYKSVSTGMINNTLEFVRANSIIPATTTMPSWLDDRQGYSITFTNGVAALDDLLLNKMDCIKPHSPQWFSKVALPYEYNPDAKCPWWMQMLNMNLEGDCERLDLLQEFAGYCLTHDTEFHAMLMLTGEGGDGKSCVLAGIKGMLGDQNCSSLSLNELGEKFKLPRIVGKLANICADLSETSHTCEASLKKLVSGDPMEFEEKFRQPFMAIPTAKLLFSANSLPHFYDRTKGLWRRLMVMPFKRTVQDHEKITGMDKSDWWFTKGELPGIFNWALIGLQRLRSKGEFSQSALCIEALNEHRRESNNALSWLTDEYVLDPEGQVSRKDMYSAYSAYCKEFGLRPLGGTQFGKEVTKTFGKLECKRLVYYGERPEWRGRRDRFHIGIREKNERDRVEIDLFELELT